ncbi:hypothetical protein FPOAC1_010417 [Fusarium poae]|uniref:hypothetical protein n=1 Tax=Fusarium poae TaxID=36050 RepID=UPI001CE73E01|nr:hypothetical protein FPOAC1_010417 [Fusarium poae]KAG8665618.1 hypothetical protein FPOAC1_010417 [Fusarium poae]
MTFRGTSPALTQLHQSIPDPCRRQINRPIIIISPRDIAIVSTSKAIAAYMMARWHFQIHRPRITKHHASRL